MLIQALQNLRSTFSPSTYLDNSATTKTRLRVMLSMARYFSGRYANPSSLHRSGLVARASVELAREQIAANLGCSANEITFTSSGSEGNNMALRGLLGPQFQGKRVVSSRIEHSSIVNTLLDLEQQGLEVAWIGVDALGHYNLSELQADLKKPTDLVALSYVNSEIGTVQNLKALQKLVKAHGALLHIDAVQALPYLDIHLNRLGADTVVFSGHKFHAPKGIGLLYTREGTSLKPLVTGGGQEAGLRSGTENVPYIMGLRTAIALNRREKAKTIRKLIPLQKLLIEGVLASIPDVILTGDPINRSPHHASFAFKSLSGKQLVQRLSWLGFEVSSGSACNASKKEAPAALVATGVDSEYQNGSVRITLSRDSTKGQIRRLLAVLPTAVATLRAEPTANIGSSFISQQDFSQHIKQGEPLQILDVRPVRSVRYNLPGLVEVPLWRLPQATKALDPHAPTVVICYHGDTLAPAAQQQLMRQGFTQVRVLQGGFSALFV